VQASFGVNESLVKAKLNPAATKTVVQGVLRMEYRREDQHLSIEIQPYRVPTVAGSTRSQRSSRQLAQSRGRVAVEFTEEVSEIWFREEFPRWGWGKGPVYLRLSVPPGLIPPPPPFGPILDSTVTATLVRDYGRGG